MNIVSAKLRYVITVITLVICLNLPACSDSANPGSLITMGGLTMGTTYTVKINEPDLVLSNEDIHVAVESILNGISHKMSTYLRDSELSVLNQAPSQEWVDLSFDLHKIIKDAIFINKLTNGSFDITVGPLVNLWGFGPDNEKQKVPPVEEISQALSQTGTQHLQLRQFPASLKKVIDNIYIDLSAIAKGYAVDKIAEYLSQQGIENYLVEIGGEIRAKGTNEIGFAWRIGIEKADPESRVVQRIIKLENIAMATSGDYRNYFEENGQRFSHTIDPLTGKPVTHNLASVTVLHESTAWADALATGFLVMGKEAAEKIAQQENIAVLFLERTQRGLAESYTQAFQYFLLDN